MTVRLPAVFAVICVAALFGYGIAQLNCNKISWGSGQPIRTGPRPIPPGVRTLEVSIPGHCDPSGWDVVACDSDEPPNIRFLNRWTALIERKGNLVETAAVHSTIQCYTL
ncbi:uncharacterized protein LOC142985303 [Anticarsia gemmatalis]|uniref:uncharacterized protein LOC142985303 n=1 Tax=Anticarsia gemmatalis TaxID=129554 RepID=UPI003F76E94D